MRTGGSEEGVVSQEAGVQGRDAVDAPAADDVDVQGGAGAPTVAAVPLEAVDLPDVLEDGLMLVCSADWGRKPLIGVEDGKTVDVMVLTAMQVMRNA